MYVPTQRKNIFVWTLAPLLSVVDKDEVFTNAKKSRKLLRRRATGPPSLLKVDLRPAWCESQSFIFLRVQPEGQNT